MIFFKIEILTNNFLFHKNDHYFINLVKQQYRYTKICECTVEIPYKLIKMANLPFFFISLHLYIKFWPIKHFRNSILQFLEYCIKISGRLICKWEQLSKELLWKFFLLSWRLVRQLERANRIQQDRLVNLKNEWSYDFWKRILDLILRKKKTCFLDLKVGKFVEFLILDYLQVFLSNSSCSEIWKCKVVYFILF